MKKSTKILFIAVLTALPVAPSFWRSHSETNKIPFLEESSKKPTIGLQDLVSRLRLMNSARAGTSLTQHPTNNLRDSIGLAIGYGDHVAYGNLACNGVDPGPNTDCSGPPYDGIVGRLTTILNTLPAIGLSAGIASCEAVPASGSATGTDSNGNSVTIHFQTPTHAIPSPWLGGGGTFQKRVELDETLLGDATKIAYEFNCGDSPALYAAINMDMGTIDTHAYTRLISVFTGPITASKNGIEVYMAEYSSAATRIRSADAIRIEYTPSSSEFNLWGVMNTNLSGGKQIVSRTAIHGNYSTGSASVFYDGYQAPSQAGSDSAIDVTAVDATASFANAVDLTNGAGASPGHDFNQDLVATYTVPREVFKEGCIDFTAPNTAPGNTSDCAGLALSAVSGAPYVDTGGALSIQWTLVTMPTKLEVIP